ncbi:hypothetical protein PHSC3_001747 [Chlamydiales bacterium STE3]|nr:hypothetical protein PHSC3_001747 [Chlamydiales bacterium STE3]
MKSPIILFLKQLICYNIFQKTGFYMPNVFRKDFDPREFPDYKPKILKKELKINFNGKEYLCTKILEKEYRGIDRFLICCKAIVEIVGTGGILLFFSESARQDWHAARFGKKEIYILQGKNAHEIGSERLLLPEDPLKAEEVAEELLKDEPEVIAPTLKELEHQEDPFDFANLPIETQLLIYSFLPIKTVAQMKEVSQETQASAQTFLQLLEVNICLLPALAKKSLKKYEECLAFILDHPKLKSNLGGNKTIKDLFFEHILSSDSPQIFENLSESQLIALINLFIEKASQIQFQRLFINCASQKSANFKHLYPKLLICLLEPLTDQQLEDVKRSCQSILSK